MTNSPAATHPSADELLGAVAAFIARIGPELKDRDVFLARVAGNALAVVRRELMASQGSQGAADDRLTALLGAARDDADPNAALCEAIRAGAFDDREVALLAYLKAAAIEQVLIDQPTYSGLKAAASKD